jgi:hypothetical protein
MRDSGTMDVRTVDIVSFPNNKSAIQENKPIIYESLCEPLRFFLHV